MNDLIIDFFSPSEDNKGSSTLVVLAEEELVVIDLSSPEWVALPLPYLVSLHASAVTFSAVVSDLSPSLWNDLNLASQAQTPPSESVSTVLVTSSTYWTCDLRTINTVQMSKI